MAAYEFSPPRTLPTPRQLDQLQHLWRRTALLCDLLPAAVVVAVGASPAGSHLAVDHSYRRNCLVVDCNLHHHYNRLAEEDSLRSCPGPGMFGGGVGRCVRRFED